MPELWDNLSPLPPLSPTPQANSTKLPTHGFARRLARRYSAPMTGKRSDNSLPVYCGKRLNPGIDPTSNGSVLDAADVGAVPRRLLAPRQIYCAIQGSQVGQDKDEDPSENSVANEARPATPRPRARCQGQGAARGDAAPAPAVPRGRPNHLAARQPPRRECAARPLVFAICRGPPKGQASEQEIPAS